MQHILLLLLIVPRGSEFLSQDIIIPPTFPLPLIFHPILSLSNLCRLPLKICLTHCFVVFFLYTEIIISSSLFSCIIITRFVTRSIQEIRGIGQQQMRSIASIFFIYAILIAQVSDPYTWAKKTQQHDIRSLITQFWLGLHRTFFDFIKLFLAIFFLIYLIYSDLWMSHVPKYLQYLTLFTFYT